MPRGHTANQHQCLFVVTAEGYLSDLSDLMRRLKRQRFLERHHELQKENPG